MDSGMSLLKNNQEAVFFNNLKDMKVLEGRKTTGSSSKFLNICEIESHFRCPIVGAILSVEKHQAILKKCGYNTKNMKSYEYHQKLMSKLDSENTVSVKTNNYLHNQARKCMKEITGLSETEIRKKWNKYKSTGNVGPMMFAIVSREGTGDELLHDIYGEVHMLAHANMTKVFSIQDQLVKTQNLLKREKKTLVRKSDEFKSLGKIRKTEIRRLKELELENRQLKNRLAKAEKSPLTGQGLEPVVTHLEDQICELEKTARSYKEQAQVHQKKIERLQNELFTAKNENSVLNDELQELIGTFSSFTVPEVPDLENCPPGCSHNACSSETCTQYQLCAKRVFMIGGLTKMKSYYKEIVEKAGGEFDYHDGYLKNTSANLEARVKRSDVVICPVNCNSHNACLAVKKICNRYNKQLKILSSSSLSAVANALFNPTNEIVLN